jgi:hypothetical protein
VYLVMRFLLAVSGLYYVGWRLQILFWWSLILWAAGLGLYRLSLCEGRETGIVSSRFFCRWTLALSYIGGPLRSTFRNWRLPTAIPVFRPQ